MTEPSSIKGLLRPILFVDLSRGGTTSVSSGRRDRGEATPEKERGNVRIGQDPDQRLHDQAAERTRDPYERHAALAQAQLKEIWRAI